MWEYRIAKEMGWTLKDVRGLDSWWFMRIMTYISTRNEIEAGWDTDERSKARVGDKNPTREINPDKQNVRPAKVRIVD